MGKDMFMFFEYFFIPFISLSIVAAHKSGNNALIAPIIPLAFVYAYQWDMYRGRKMKRVREEARRLKSDEPERFFPAENNRIWTMDEYKNIIGKEKKNI